MCCSSSQACVWCCPAPDLGCLLSLWDVVSRWLNWQGKVSGKYHLAILSAGLLGFTPKGMSASHRWMSLLPVCHRRRQDSPRGIWFEDVYENPVSASLLFPHAFIDCTVRLVLCCTHNGCKPLSMISVFWVAFDFLNLCYFHLLVWAWANFIIYCGANNSVCCKSSPLNLFAIVKCATITQIDFHHRNDSHS